MPGLVVITGIAGNLGKALARLLHTETRIVGIDRRPFRERPKDVEHYEVDIRKRKVDEVFRRHRVEALIHLGIMHDPRMPFSEAHSFNILGTRKVLDLCVQHGVRKVVVLSSATVYGPRPDNSNFLV
jgi:UDP-glucose 4-epimerase